MPIIVPPFVQYQSPLVPLRGLWNSAPPEGDRFVTADIEWGVTTGNGMAVQFSLASASPVPLSQLAALGVDNSRCGCDVRFLFPDSGAVLVVPAYVQGVFAVFTNALMFYCAALAAVVGDNTIFLAFNSLPPTGTVSASSQQSVANVVGIGLAADASVLIVSGTGTLLGFQLLATAEAGDVAQAVRITLLDGLGGVVWGGWAAFGAGSVASLPISVSGLRQRFSEGLYLVIGGSDVTAGEATVNAFYSRP